MGLFKCGTCHAVYEGHYPPDDTCTKCHSGTICITNHKEDTMTAITPTIKLFTSNKDTGIKINRLIMEYNGNNYHFHGATSDTIHVFTQSIAIYVLTINKGYGRMAVTSRVKSEEFSRGTLGET